VIFKHESAQSDLNGFLDSGSHVHGELEFEASFRVDGRFTGKIVSPGSLVVGEGGEVDGEVRAAQIFVSGTLRGTVQADKRLQIAAGGRVFADVSTPSLIIEDGAIFEGRCAMTREAEPAAKDPGPKRLVEAAGRD
jgi:cytoskeletal protein CcmA (bactofilin family)